MLTNPEGECRTVIGCGEGVSDLLRTPTQNLRLSRCVQLSMRCVTHPSLMGTSYGIDRDSTGQLLVVMCV